MPSETLSYRHAEVTLHAELFVPEGTDGALPTVLVSHTARGKTDFERDKCKMLNGLGYAAVLLDNLAGEVGRGPEDGKRMTAPWLADRAALAQRLLAGYDAACAHPRVDAARIVAMGFCFGGLCSLDLARAGLPLLGAVSFHGLLTPSGLAPKPIKASVLVLHGYDDPLAPPSQLEALHAELARADCDWQVHAYGRTVHAFTNPAANAADLGLLYDATADRRAFTNLRAFLAERFD